LRGGRPQWEVTEKDNQTNAWLMLLFFVALFAFAMWHLYEFTPNILPRSASEHGEYVDWLLNFNLLIIGIVATVTNFLLFYFAFKYVKGKKNEKPIFFPESNKLELIWTVVPGIALTVIIFLGIKTWSNITSVPEGESLVVELYAKQFDWTARYAGQDNILGKRNFKKIVEGINPMGLDLTDPHVKDDIVVRGEFHIPKGKRVYFKFGSRDVIHSAYMPHFRAQMNCVPGMTTEFHFVPTITTDSMRKDPQVIKNMEEVNDELAKRGEPPVEFNYLLLCNKICGVSHWNMQMNIIVDEPEQFETWLKKQKTVEETMIQATRVEEEKSNMLVEKKEL
jgi:cytochrome c oxidase subunit 2